MSKITAEMIIDKLNELPEADKQTIMDFIEYLALKQERKKGKKNQPVSESAS